MDETETIRRSMIANGVPEADLQKAEQRWDTAALTRDFDVLGFMAPFVAVRRKSDGKKGSLEFTHSPRFYFNWKED